MRHRILAACIALLSCLAPSADAMGSSTRELRLSYEGEAYRAWPVIFEFLFNGASASIFMTPDCCIEDNRAPGATGGAGASIFYKGDTPDITLDVIWVEVHSNTSFRTQLTFSTDEIVGWSGGNVNLTFSFRPGGELVLYADGPALAATRLGPDLDIRSGEDMAAVLLTPGLGRAHRRDDYIELRRACGTVNADPPERFRDARAQFGPQTLAQIDANRLLPLPEPKCEMVGR